MSEPIAPEPSMDDILASIRKIISDDDTPVGGMDPVEAVYAKEPPMSAPPSSTPEEEHLVGESASVTTASAFDRLSLAAHEPPAPTGPAIAMPAPGLTLDAVVKDMLRPMLKTWLDENLPAIVQARVDEEVDRISRGRGR